MPKDDADSAPFDEDDAQSGRTSDGLGGVPEIIRRFAALGLSGFFTTESALRRALGDTVPKEWVDFAADQSERTREELLDRMSSEFGRVLASIDLVRMAEELLENRTVEIEMKIRLGAKEDDGPPKKRGGVAHDEPTDER
jgi:hypothetical protein